MPWYNGTMRFCAIPILLLLWLSSLCVAAAPTTAPATAPAGPYARQLRRECDAILSTAIRRPYGWAWEANVAPPAVAASKGRPASRPVPPTADMTSPGTAAAGYVLFWSADLLDEPRYREAAFQVARGLGAAQRPRGQVPPKPVFLPDGAGGNDEVTLVTNRGPTCAALGLLLTLIDEGGRSQPILQQSAARASGWLLRQQAPSGSWPVGYPPATQPKDATRIVRLDTPDYRDCTLAMLYCYEVLGNPLQRASVERSADLLLRMRLGNVSKVGAKLWSNCYLADGLPSDRIQHEVFSGIDVLASRYAAQTLFADYLVLASVASDTAVAEAAAAVEPLPRDGGQWTRVYDDRGDPYKLDPRVAKPSDPFHTAAEVVVPPSMRTGTFGWEALLPAVKQAQTDGRVAYERKLADGFTYKQQLAAMLVGLSDDVMTGFFPVRREEVAAYIQRREGDWKLLGGDPPAELSARTRRLWLLFLRAKVEQKFGQ